MPPAGVSVGPRIVGIRRRAVYNPLVPVPELRDILGGRRLLLVVAAPAEARTIRSGLSAQGILEPPASGGWTLTQPAPRFDMVETGVGKANAAAGLARVVDPRCHAAILNIGIGGALPGGGADLGATIVATASVYADEGLETPEGFTDCAGLGFPLGPFSGSSIAADPDLLALLGPLADRSARVATVSTCSGTDALAARVAARTGAIVEAMEGAAIAHVAARLGIPFVEVRAISNTTGDRSRQRWDVRLALDAVSRLIGRLSSLPP